MIMLFLSLKFVFILANSGAPDEMQHYYAAFHLGLQCLQKYLFKGFQYTKGLRVTLHICGKYQNIMDWSI